MLPVRDENPTTVFAWMTLVFIAVNVFVFVEFRLAGTAAEQELLLYESAAISCEIAPGLPLSVGEARSGECSTELGELVAEGKNVFLANRSRLA
jgi:hypothetical protein